MIPRFAESRRTRAPAPPRPRGERGRGRGRQLVDNFGPNWFTSVMGTGIVANAAATLPVHATALTFAATAVWLLAAVLLVGAGITWALHFALRRGRPHVTDPFLVQYFGAPPMALLTVGAGTLLVGRHVIGERAAVAVAWTLWSAGAVSGLAAAVLVPLWMFTRHRSAPDSVFASWLMPLVPPMVAAAGGALLVPHAAPGQARTSVLIACYAMFGAGLLASTVVITLVWWRLTQHNQGPAVLVPTLWIVLGPLGQSVTAANLLGDVAPLAVPPPYSTGLAVFGLVYGVPVWGFAVFWAAIAALITLRTARAKLPFSLTWWSFTFPVGVVVTGTSELAERSHAAVFAVAAVLFYAGLVCAWAVVGVRTLRGCVRGTLFAPGPAAGGHS
ncbi:tellurite resistance protein TehA-like permease [Saccharopolyspora erythraea NRRL 2338]|nr:TDT family transporter [Saccharopolyspora erythraea]EQD82572.1 C4-dicarboxylate ABC transporter [Saccharopolyspora erythraea D]PFG97040.1 tellurite resistance protein TehA-like permease [Saccharopolyspora erythraea NRRL 2338]